MEYSRQVQAALPGKPTPAGQDRTMSFATVLTDEGGSPVNVRASGMQMHGSALLTTASSSRGSLHGSSQHMCSSHASCKATVQLQPAQAGRQASA